MLLLFFLNEVWIRCSSFITLLAQNSEWNPLIKYLDNMEKIFFLLD